VTWRFDPGGDDLAFEPLYDDRYVAGAKNPWTRRRRIKLAELMNESQGDLQRACERPSKPRLNPVNSGREAPSSM
jgi:hypothetical protein